MDCNCIDELIADIKYMASLVEGQPYLVISSRVAREAKEQLGVDWKEKIFDGIVIVT